MMPSRPWPWLQNAEQLLAAQAQQHVHLQCEVVQLRVLVTATRQASAALTQRW